MKTLKATGMKKCFANRKTEFGDHKNCLVATEVENKINHLKRNEIEENSPKKDH